MVKARTLREELVEDVRKAEERLKRARLLLKTYDRLHVGRDQKVKVKGHRNEQQMGVI